MKKRNSPSITMLHHGPIMDVSDGYLDCSDALSSLLYELHDRKVIPKKSRRIKVIVSDLAGRKDEIPTRIEKVKIYTFGYLLREYALIKGRSFDKDIHKEEKGFELEALAQQGKKAMAFSGYGQFMHRQKLIKQDKVVRSLPEEQREAKQKEFDAKNGPLVLRIG